ncbi:MAG TPA: hypothetical protein VMT32_22570 [Bryobacteraceae bacterium]|nr:hypothetical protein [Bryobacteraceae bacterium]
MQLLLGVERQVEADAKRPVMIDQRLVIEHSFDVFSPLLETLLPVFRVCREPQYLGPPETQ